MAWGSKPPGRSRRAPRLGALGTPTGLIGGQLRLGQEAALAAVGLELDEAAGAVQDIGEALAHRHQQPAAGRRAVRERRLDRHAVGLRDVVAPVAVEHAPLPAVPDWDMRPVSAGSRSKKRAGHSRSGGVHCAPACTLLRWPAGGDLRATEESHDVRRQEHTRRTGARRRPAAAPAGRSRRHLRPVEAARRRRPERSGRWRRARSPPRDGA